MNATDNIATDLFYKIRSRFRGLKLGAEDGTITIKPNEARFFDFDYMEGETPIGHVSISLAEANSIKVYFSTGITESMNGQQKSNWYGFLKELRQFAKRRLMSFDTRDISKDNLDERDFAFLSQNAMSQQNTTNEPVGESVMNESAMYGTKTMSFQKLMDTRLIIKHSQALVDDTQPGARTRHISALFVENQEGERFKYPFIHLAGARAMQRHVANGGVPYDDIGKSIITMSEQIAQLKSFNNYVVRNDLMNSDTNNIVERSSSALDTLREQIKKMSKQSHYEAYRENFQLQEMPEVPDEVVEDFTEKFTVRNFKEDIKSVFPVLYKLMQENDNTVDYDDIVEITSEEEDVQEEYEDSYDPFEKFEEWAMTLGERSAVQDTEQQDAAIRELNELMGQHFPAGVDGTNAIESLSGIIDDPTLHKEIEQAAKKDPDTCVRPLVKQWLESNVPEIVDQIDFGDMTEEDDGAKKSDVPAALRKAKGDKDWKVSTKDLDKEKERNISSSEWLKKHQSESVDTQELAEFINSFYDKESGTFPKGPEGVATMVGKKFGERAEQAARKMVERMAPQQADPELQELNRMRDLAGVQTNEQSYGSFEDVLSDMPKDVEHFKRTGDMTDDLYQTAYDYMFQKGIHGGRGDPYEQVANFVSDYIDVDESANETVETEGQPERYADQLAKRVFDMNPNLSTSGTADELLDVGFDVMAQEHGSKQARSWFSYNEDFPSDFVSAYSYLQKNQGGSESVQTEEPVPELEDIKKLSGISQGLGF